MCHSHQHYPMGAIVGVAWLNACIHTEDGWNIGPVERRFGDWGPNRYAWQMTQVKALPEPISCSGARGLWKPSQDVLDRIPHDLLPFDPMESHNRRLEVEAKSDIEDPNYWIRKV